MQVVASSVRCVLSWSAVLQGGMQVVGGEWHVVPQVMFVSSAVGGRACGGEWREVVGVSNCGQQCCGLACTWL
jgi:hypothetical protein